MSSRLESIKGVIGSVYPKELITPLIDEYNELNRRFTLGDYRPSQLSGARFSEAAFRICDFMCTGSFTSVGKKLEDVDKLARRLEQTPSANTDDTFRLHIPKVLRFIYDLRNRRDVAHLGTGISPNISDASVILSCAGWVLAEVVRVSHNCNLSEAQILVDSLVERRIPLIWEDGEVVRVLDPTLNYKDRVLLLLRHFHPNRVSKAKLFQSVGHTNVTRFEKDVLLNLHENALIDYRVGHAIILPPGIKAIEETINS